MAGDSLPSRGGASGDADARDAGGLAPTRQGSGDVARPRRPLRVIHLESFEEAVALGPAEREAYRRRFLTLFLDESSTRRGGIGRVSRVANAMGETFALKVLAPPVKDEFDADDAPARRLEALRAAFREEYEAHRALTGFRGFPRLYGWCEVDGMPAILMEWVEGVTLSRARRELAVDDDGRMSPLSVARLGRDLFALLERLSSVGEGYVHRDISAANVMVRTSHLSVARQASEGAFDLCLVDFGSSAQAVEQDDSFTQTYATVRRATPAYAPPEMLTDDVPGLAALRKSPAIDAYAAGSVLYELLCGRVPFPTKADKAGAAGEGSSLYLRKSSGLPEAPVCAHAAGSQLSAVLAREPDVAVAAACASLEMPQQPDEAELRDALLHVDAQLASIVMRCLEPKPDDRPSADAVRAGLEAFCLHYPDNVARSLRREPLMPCMAGDSWLAGMPPFSARRMVRSVLRGLALGAWLAVVASASWLLDGSWAVVRVGGLAWEGHLDGRAVAVALMLPLVAALLARLRGGVSSRTRFLRGSAALVLVQACVLAIILGMGFDPAEKSRGMLAAVFATFAAAWFALVVDYAIVMVPALLGSRARGLPAHDEWEGAALGGPRTAVPVLGVTAAGDGAPHAGAGLPGGGEPRVESPAGPAADTFPPDGAAFDVGEDGDNHDREDEDHHGIQHD